MKLRKNVSALLLLSIFTTATIPQGVQAESWQSYKIDTEEVANEKISEAFNKFRYEMTVEWDQRDPFFKDHAQKQFEASLASLSKSGVSLKEIQAFMQKNMMDEAAKSDYERLMAALTKQDLQDEAGAKLAMDYMEKNHKQGVGFNGGGGSGSGSRAVAIVVGIIIIGVVTYLILKDRKHDSDTGSTGSTGENGSTGETGRNGETGHNGSTGYNGSTGHNGSTGYNGTSGHNGKPGMDFATI